MPNADGTPTDEETAAAEQAAATQRQADTTALQEQLAQAQARNMELETAAIRAANPDLPDAAFAGGDLAAIQASVATARAVADHVREQTVANGAATPAAAAAAVAAAAAATPTGAGAQRTPPAPEGLKGIDRIKFGLAQRS